MRLWTSFILACLVLLFSAPHESASGSELTVYVAKKFITMDPTRPIATAVAVRGDRIVSVGSIEDLEPWLRAHPHRFERRFQNDVVMPGLIDTHLHPLFGALLLNLEWITPDAWDLGDRTVPATRTPGEFWDRLDSLLRSTSAEQRDSLVAVWGWNENYHGPVTRSMLDGLGTGMAVMVWHRSTHEAVFNTVALAYLGIDESVASEYPAQVDYANGHFWEAALMDAAMPRISQHWLSPDYIDRGYGRFIRYLLPSGITTVGDMATGGFDWELELAALNRNLVANEAPFRTVIVPVASALARSSGGLGESFQVVDSFMSDPEPPPQLVLGKRIKLLADGAMLSQLVRMNPPGYIDGHEGEWIMEPDELEVYARKYWSAGYRIHVHANGDQGIGAVLSILEQLQSEAPRMPHNLVIEHYGYADEALNRRVALAGAAVSANPYYVHLLSEEFSSHGFGADRARRMVPISSLVDRNVPVSLHSDFGIAPARPFQSAWAAVTRESLNGTVQSPPRGLTVAEAMRAITVDAAYVLGLEQDIGSIQSGKKADFAILDRDPFAIDAVQLKDVRVLATVFEGAVAYEGGSQSP